MRKKIILSLMVGAALFAYGGTKFNAKAATLDEVVSTAREYGYSEDEIQAALNKYYEEPDLYDDSDMDNIISQIKSNGKKVISTVPYDPDVTIPALTTTATVATTQTNATTGERSTSASGGATTVVTGGGNSGGSGTITNPVSTDITLTMPDGSTFTRISAEDFISLSYEDKLLYLGTFTAEQQEVFIANLTPEEYRSLMKQLPTDKKVDVVSGMSDIADSFGLNLTVDELTDNSIVISMKDDDGTLVSVNRAGDTVEDTGYDRRGILAIAAGFVIFGIMSIIAVSRKYFGRCENE